MNKFPLVDKRVNFQLIWSHFSPNVERNGSIVNIWNISIHVFTEFVRRLEWESSIVKGSATLRRLEEERLAQLANRAEQYLTIMEESR